MFGREDVLADLAASPARVRGTDVDHRAWGKSRLALRVAWSSGASAIWCDLRGCRSSAELSGALAAGLDIEVTGEAPSVRIGEELAALGRAIVVLDGAESVPSSFEHDLETWCTAAPRVSFLITSRSAPGFISQDVFSVGLMAETDAVALLMARPPQPIEPETAGAIIRAVDGLPPRYRAGGWTAETTLSRPTPEPPVIAAISGRDGTGLDGRWTARCAGSVLEPAPEGGPATLWLQSASSRAPLR